MYSPLFVDSLSIAEVDVLKILGIYLDCKLTWNSIIKQLAAPSSRDWVLFFVLEIILARVVSLLCCF